MLPYALRNSIGNVPSTLMLGLSPNPAPAILNQNPMQLSLNVNSNQVNKDSQWLTLEVCREYQRGMCPRSDLECKYAHPPPYLETSSGRVVCCYDSIKGKCHRVKPPCKYLHPPQHLKDILIQNGKNNLLMKNLQMNIIQQQLSSLTGTPQSRLGLIPVTPKFLNESQTSPATEPTVTTSSNNYSFANYFDVSNDISSHVQAGTTFSSECQTTQYQSNYVPPEAPPVSVSIVAAPTLALSDLPGTKKRSLTQMYQNGIVNETYIQQQTEEHHVPIKRQMISESHLSTPHLLMNRDQPMNGLGYLVNPFASYQNQLAAATYLALNSQAGLHANGLNVPTILTNTPQFQTLAPGLIYANSPVSANNLSFMANLQNQQQLAMILNAANNLQGTRTFSEFAAFK